MTVGTSQQQIDAAQTLSLYTLSPAIEEALLNAFSISRSSEVRAVIADVLGEKKSQRAVPVLIQSLTDRDEVVRNNAAIAVTEIGSRQALRKLAGELLVQEYEDSTIKYIAPNIAADLVAVGIRTWHTLKPHESIRLTHALTLCLPYAFPHIFRALSSDQHTLRSNAWQLFEEILDDAQDLNLVDEDQLLLVLEHSIDDQLWEVRYRTIHILAALRKSEAIPVLLRALHHPDVNTRPFAAYWLAERYKRRPQVLGYLIEAYHSEQDKDVKRRIGWLLGSDRPKSQLERIYTITSEVDPFVKTTDRPD